MGYRNYIGYIRKREYNKIKSLTLDELYDFYGLAGEDRYKGVYDFGHQLYEFGKYVDFDPPKESMKKFFKKKETQKEYEIDHELYVVSKQFLAYIIQHYREKIKKYYNKMLNPFFSKDKENPSEFLNTIKTDYSFSDNKHTFDFSKITNEEQEALFLMIEHIRSFGIEWRNMIPYDLENGEEITTSWKYEYGIFELIRIYKSFDWKKNVMIYYGY